MSKKRDSKGRFVAGSGSLKKKLRKMGPSKRASFRQALYIGGQFLQEQSMLIVPVDFDKLRGSAFTRIEKGTSKPTVIVGYTATYAVYVHEDLNARHEPGKTAKYLEKPLRQKRDQIVKLVKLKMKGVRI